MKLDDCNASYDQQQPETLRGQRKQQRSWLISAAIVLLMMMITTSHCSSDLICPSDNYDIIFIMEDSAAVATQFSAVKTFMANVVNNCVIDAVRTR